jgi:serine/threonine protein kinase
VVEALDTKTQKKIAIKKIERAFEHATFSLRTLRELKIMRLLKHENVNSI